VIATGHPHGVIAFSGQFDITLDYRISGNYTIQDEESLSNDPPPPPGTWEYLIDGWLHEDGQDMILNYTLNYTPEGNPTETYTGAWQARRW
jgi:hypothetical protein